MAHGVLKDNSKATQRRTILKVLREHSASTFDFRQMGIVSPAPRIKELREQGYQIETTRIRSLDHTGQQHGGVTTRLPSNVNSNRTRCFLLYPLDESNEEEQAIQ